MARKNKHKFHLQTIKQLKSEENKYREGPVEKRLGGNQKTC